MSDEKYFNFPIQLLKGFLTDSRRVLRNISYYAIYTHSLNLDYGDEKERIKDSAKYFVVNIENIDDFIEKGKNLHYNTGSNYPKVGINLSIFWDFYTNDKSDFEKVCLLGFLAIKSILQQKPYCKIDNKFWFARMDGKPKSCEQDKLSTGMKKYFNDYQARKIKSMLVDNWGLKTYSHYTRGFYVSFQLEYEELVYQAEKRRKSNLDKQKKRRKHEALKKALLRLGDAKP